MKGSHATAELGTVQLTIVRIKRGEPPQVTYAPGHNNSKFMNWIANRLWAKGDYEHIIISDGKSHVSLSRAMEILCKPSNQGDTA